MIESETGLDLNVRALCGDRWHTERPHPCSVVLRYLDSPHRTGHVTASAHSVPELVEVVPLVALELSDADRIYTRCSFVGPDPLPRLKDQALGYFKRLHL